MILAARVPLLYVVRRMVIEVPFLVFAALIPFVATGPRIDVLGVSVSEPGPAGRVGSGRQGHDRRDVVADPGRDHRAERGAGRSARLRMPDLIVQIMGFMIRYLDVVTADLGRMLVAMRSRGADPRSPRHWPALARTLGALFVRSYERGERVHLAMLSRGYDGTMR